VRDRETEASLQGDAMNRIHAIIGLAFLLAESSAVVAAGPGSCDLVTVAELEAALGVKAKGKPAGTKQAVPGMSLDECSVVLAGPGRTHPVSVRVVGNLGMNGEQAISMRNAGTAREKQWTVPGAKLEQATVGKAICILSGRPNVASQSICSIPRGQGYVEVEVTGDVGNLPALATVAALVQKAASRL
jgi:hypothetical protein